MYLLVMLFKSALGGKESKHSQTCERIEDFDYSYNQWKERVDRNEWQYIKLKLYEVDWHTDTFTLIASRKAEYIQPRIINPVPVQERHWTDMNKTAYRNANH
jgi:hypothetical protein